VTAFRALRTGDRAAFLATLRGNPRLSTLRGPAGATPLMMAALYGDAPLVKELLDQGASPDVWNDAGATALMWSAGDLETVKLLVERGADVNARSNDARTPLLVAAGIRGNRDVVALLLDKGAKPSVKAPWVVADMTPLGEAAKQGDETIVRLLIERGADVPGAGFLPLALALRQQCNGCIDALMPKLPPPLFTPVMVLGSPPLGPALATIPMLEHGADPNGRGPAGYPILLLAAASEAQPVAAVKALLDRGADLNARGPNGETALGLACRHGHTPVVDLLVQAGAKDVDVAPSPVAFSPAHSAREAVARSLPLLQRADETFTQKSGCVSCHNNSQTAMTVALARLRGVPMDEEIARRQLAKTWRSGASARCRETGSPATRTRSARFSWARRRTLRAGSDDRRLRAVREAAAVAGRPVEGVRASAAARIRRRQGNRVGDARAPALRAGVRA
jgi:ankyrin repeat protein